MATDGKFVMAAEPYFEISTIQDQNGHHTVTVSGALDIGSTPHLENVLNWILRAPGTREVIIDLAGLKYLGATGARALLTAAQAAEARKIKLSARNPQDLVDTILHLTDVAGPLHLPTAPLDEVADLAHRSAAGQE